MEAFGLTIGIYERSVFRLNIGLYRMITAAQRDDSHQSNCNLLNSVVNVVTRDLFENELFALQVVGQLEQQNTRVLVEWPNSNTGQK